MTDLVFRLFASAATRRRFRVEYLHDRLTRLPMVRVVVPFVVGAGAAMRWELPLVAVLCGLCLCGAMALRFRSQLYTAVSLALFGFVVVQLHDIPVSVPTNLRTDFEFTLSAPPVARNGYASCTASVQAWRDPASGRWHAAQGGVVIRADSVLRLLAGERLVCTGTVRPFPAAYPDYRRRMLRRGYAGTFALSPHRLLVADSISSRSYRSLHLLAVRRLERLPLSAEAQALCRAMVAGDPGGLPPALRTAYARSGISHLLAVSGLHAGIVFMLVNLLLWGVPALWPRRGHLVKNLAVVALIWTYAAVADFSPSVVRAAVMCSMLQFALASASAYAGLNTLAAAAFVMLLFRPSWLCEIGFQLSFVSVAAILAWGIPLCRRLRTRRRWIDWPVAATIVSAVATAAAAPLVSHAFGFVSLVGLIVNPVAILLAHVVVFAGVVWIALPAGWLAPVFAPVLEWGVRLLDGVAFAAAALPWSGVEVRLTTAQTLGCYAFFLAATLTAACRSPKKSVSLPR